MLIFDLKNFITRQREQNTNPLYLFSLLKEYLQAYVLNFIYAESIYRGDMIFTGGTCLRHCYGLNRLSEDLDFDLINPIDITTLGQQLVTDFKNRLGFELLQTSIKQKGKQLLLKFPILRILGLSDLSDSDLLYVKLDLSPVASDHYSLIKSLQNKQGLNYLVAHYDLPSLMAGKLHAILRRQRFWGGEDQPTVKGRDYFDLLWFLQKAIIPNEKRLFDLLGEPLDRQKLIKNLDKKVIEATGPFKTEFRRDLLPFIEDVRLADGFIEGYLEAYQEAKRYLMPQKN